MYNHHQERIIVSFWYADNWDSLSKQIKSASDAAHPCILQKNGYAGGHILRCGHRFPQDSAAANLSYPAGSSDKRRPQFLRSAYPQVGAASAPIQGHTSRIKSNAADRLRLPDSDRTGCPASLQMDIFLNSGFGDIRQLSPFPDGGYLCGTVYCCTRIHA